MTRMMIMRTKPIFYVQLILLLSILDAFFTDIGISSGWVIEANPLAALIYEWSVPAFYGWKVILPLALLALYPAISKKLFFHRLLTVTASLYIFITIYHVSWLQYALS